MGDTVTKRLHIGGLTPTITPEHLRDRFRSFGKVLDVEEMGLNALGEPRPFAYITLETTPLQLRKCLNIMSGAMWRGTQLRLAEAKPRFDVRLEKERVPVPRAEAKRSSRRLKRGIVREGGKHAQNMSLVTPETVARRTFWVEENGHLIRPLAIRPSHPLPTITKGRDGAPPPKRARVRVIDPRRWGPTHLAEAEMDGEVASPGAEWEFVDGDEEVDEDGRVVIGTWRRGGEEEEVRVRRPIEVEWSDAETETDELFPVQDRSSSPLFPGHAGSASPLFPTREQRSASPLFPARERSASPLFPARAAESSSASSPLFPAREQRSASPLFPIRDRVAVLKDEDEDAMARSSRAATPSPSPMRVAEAIALEEEAEEVPSVAAEERDEAVEEARSVRSPTPPISPLKAAEAIAIAARTRAGHMPSVDVPEQFRTQVASERQGALGVLVSLLGDGEMAPAKARNEWAAFNEDSDSDDGDYSMLKPQNYEESSDVEVEVARAAGAPSPETPIYPRRLDVPSDEVTEPTVVDDVEVALPGLESKVLRLRGGAPESDDSDSDDSDSDEDSSEDSDSDSSDDSSDDTSDDSDSDDSSNDSDDSDDSDDSSTPAPGLAGPSRLKDMFTSAPSGGFSLLGVAPDLDIDETIVLPSTTDAVEAELAPLSSAPRSTFDANAEVPLFFPLPVRPARRGEARSVLVDAVESAEGADGGEEGGNWGEEGGEWGEEKEQGWGGRQTWGQDRGWGQTEEKGKSKERKRLVAEETDAEMRERWEKRRLELTQGWKRRHREAVKHRRRRGGDDVE